MDDMLIVSTNVQEINNTKKYLTFRFKRKDLGEVDTILGIKVKKYNESYGLCQSYYIEK